MPTDLQQVLNRVIEEEYIIYHLGHYEQTIARNVDGYLSPLWMKAKANTSVDATLAQAQSMVGQMQIQGKQTAPIIDIINALDDGQVIEDILLGIEESMNNNIDQAWKDYEDVINKSHTYDKILTKEYLNSSTGRASASNVQAFLNLIVEGVQLMTGGGVPQELFAQLTKIGKAIGPQSFKFSRKGYNIMPVSQEQLRVINQIVSTLARAADRLAVNGEVSRDSLKGSVTHIFNTLLGEQIAKQLLDAAMPDLAAEVERIGDEVLKGTGTARLTNSTLTHAGTDKLYGTDKTGKVDLLNSKALQLSLEIKGSKALIDISTNMSVKWHKTNAAGMVPEVSLGQIAMGDILNGFDPKVRGVMQNIIAHSWGDNAAYQKLRSTVAATYLNQYASGSGGLTTAGNIDRAQLLLVNGELYTISALVKDILANLPYGEIGDARMSFEGITKVKNNWVKEEGDTGYSPSWKLARERASIVREAINRMSISAIVKLT